MKKLLVVILVVLSLFALTGCGEGTVTVIDREGNEVEISGSIERIISTAPSNTEIFC